MSLRAVALLVDLDNTLVPKLPNYGAAFAAACGPLAHDRGLASPVADYCLRHGIGSPTSLLSDFPGEAPELALRGSGLPATVTRRGATGCGPRAWSMPTRSPSR